MIVFILASSLVIPIIPDEKIPFDNHSTPSESSSSSQIISTPEDSDKFDASPMEDILPDDLSSEIMSINSDQPDELSCIDNHRERTMSDTSSDTVDYDIPTETYTTLTFDSSQSSFSLSNSQDNEY